MTNCTHEFDGTYCNKCNRHFLRPQRCSVCGSYGGMLIDDIRFCLPCGYAHIAATQPKPTLTQRVKRWLGA